MRTIAVVLSTLLVVSSLGLAIGPAVAAQQADNGDFSGTHVAFEADASSVSNYAVNDEVIVASATMLTASDAHHQDGRHVGEDVGLIGAVEGTAVGSVDTAARARATVEFESGGRMETHDNRRGIVRFVAPDSNQAVQVNVSDDAEISEESDARLVVETDGGPQGVFVLLGSGELAENANGQVNANLYSGSELVYRQYDGDRSEDDEEAERLIEEGTATAEVYVQQSDEDGGDTAVDAVEYGGDTTVEVASESRDAVELTVERSVEAGAVILATVADEALDGDEVSVAVDGQATAEADSLGAVESSATEGEEASYHVAQSASTEATTDVAVGIDHFSERDVELASGDDAGSDGDGDGVGALGALLALVASLLAVRYRP